MAEYIEREPLLAEYDREHTGSPGRARELIANAPTTDVVPVVRCKDCRHIHIGKDVYFCRFWERWGLTPNGFCSNGAKKEGEA